MPKSFLPVLLLLLLLITSTPTVRAATGTPLSPEEIGLMIRMGFPTQEILREVEIRHLAKPLSPSDEQTLRAYGADNTLIDALKRSLALPPKAQASPPPQQQHPHPAFTDDKAGSQARPQRNNTAQVGAKMPQSASPYPVSDKMLRLLSGKLVHWQDGDLHDYDVESLRRVKWFLVYFSAYWCGSCRRFTPQLIEFRERMKPVHPQFEVLFVSCDRSLLNMKNHMKAAAMPWPALRWKTALPEITALAAGEIPCLVLFDEAGHVVSHTLRNGRYAGPQVVLNDLAKRLAGY